MVSAQRAGGSNRIPFRSELEKEVGVEKRPESSSQGPRSRTLGRSMTELSRDGGFGWEVGGRIGGGGGRGKRWSRREADEKKKGNEAGKENPVGGDTECLAQSSGSGHDHPYRWRGLQRRSGQVWVYRVPARARNGNERVRRRHLAPHHLPSSTARRRRNSFHNQFLGGRLGSCTLAPW